MNGYVCFYNGKRFECHAETLYGAKKLAVAHWRVPAKKVGLVAVMLAEKNGEPVVHVPLD
jgi:hypothetical protein